MRRILPVLLILACLVPLAGCGGSDTKRNNDYVRRLNAAQTSFARAVTAASAPGLDRSTLRRYEKALTDVIASLRRIDVPSTVKGDHAALVTAMTQFQSAVRGANDALGQRSRSGIQAAQDTLKSALSRLNTRIRRATTAINTKLGTGGGA